MRERAREAATGDAVSSYSHLGRRIARNGGSDSSVVLTVATLDYLPLLLNLLCSVAAAVEAGARPRPDPRRDRPLRRLLDDRHPPLQQRRVRRGRRRVREEGRGEEAGGPSVYPLFRGPPHGA